MRIDEDQFVNRQGQVLGRDRMSWLGAKVVQDLSQRIARQEINDEYY
jgi:hypothetical protein